jgi:hypothetical protein
MQDYLDPFRLSASLLSSNACCTHEWSDFSAENFWALVVAVAGAECASRRAELMELMQ